MPINFYCPVCNAPIRGVPDSAASQTGTCLKCGSVIRVPRAQRVNDDDIVALLGPVTKEVQPLSSGEMESGFLADESEPERSAENDNEAEIPIARHAEAMVRSTGDLSLIARSREYLRRMVSRMHRFNPRSIRRRKQLRSVLRPEEKFIDESDQIVLTNQRLLSVISREEIDLKNIESAFASDLRAASDLILHTSGERYILYGLERQFVHSVVESIRTNLAIEPGTPSLPKAARETSDLFDAVVGLPAAKEQRSLAGSDSIRAGFKPATASWATVASQATDQATNRHRNSAAALERAKRSATRQLRGRGYRPESQSESARVVRAMRNSDISQLAQLADEPGNNPLRCAALAALRDLGPQAAAALPTLKRLLGSDEFRTTRYDATQDDLLLLTMVSETFLAVSGDAKQTH